MKHVMILALGVALGAPLGGMAADRALILTTQTDRSDPEAKGNDAFTALITALQTDGFEVSLLTDARQATARRALAEFSETLADTDRALIVAEGAVAAAPFDSWYLADDIAAENVLQASAGGISLSAMADLLSDRAGRAVLALAITDLPDDAPENALPGTLGPVTLPQGVTLLAADPENILPVLSAQVLKGDVPFAALEAGEAIEMRGYLPTHVTFAATGAAPVAVAPDRLTEAEAWELLSGVDTQAALRAFLDRFPNAARSAEATARIAALDEAEADAPRKAEAALNLNRDDRRGIQQDLQVLGFYNSAIDGIFGAGTRRAVQNWQEAAGFVATGFVTGTQMVVLSVDARQLEPEPAPEPAPAEQPAPTPQPETQPAPEAESQAADTPSQAQIDAAARQEAGLLPGPVAKVLLENRLAQLGYDPGRKDGVVDQNTRNALKSYQADQDIPATGYVDNATAARLLTQ